LRKALLATLVALLVTVPAAMLNAPVQASPGDRYSGTHFGAGNLPPGCENDVPVGQQLADGVVAEDNVCHHMRTGMNGLDSPEVDVLVMVPVSPTAERDMRIMRQAVDMWEGGIDYLADEMHLGWLAQGMNFHVTVDYVDPAGEGGEFTTYPIVDPEIVIIATNPVGGAGIGIDPFQDDPVLPCHGVANPFDFEQWENLPGFDRHHEARTGTYVEDCGGSGGNVCFAINGAIDPAPETIDFFSIFDLVAHEFGHCLTVGHVGDGLEGSWGKLPSNDIMAYSTDPPGLHKCVSTLDVEGVAVRMSQFLDVNSDGAVDGDDLILANDQVGAGGNAFQVQHPRDHLYASSTGSTMDCPQPDMGLVPGPRTDWSPTPVASKRPELTITSPADGATSPDGAVSVTGVVERVSLAEEEVPPPPGPTGSYDDADDDGKTPLTEITSLGVAVTATTVEATMHLADLWPSGTPASTTGYIIAIDAQEFGSYVLDPSGAPTTSDRTAGKNLPAGTSTWDVAAKSVTFHIPKTYLAAAGVTSPYVVTSLTTIGATGDGLIADHAPEGASGVNVADAASVVGVGVVGSPIAARASTVTVEHEGEFSTADSQAATSELPEDQRATSHHYTLNVPDVSDVEVTLTWTDVTGGTDLDVVATGAADSGSAGASANTANPRENFTLHEIKGTLDLRVDPYLVVDPVAGTSYTLKAVIRTQGVDTDRDGVSDRVDACPTEAGNGFNGCPTEYVRLYVDGALAGQQAVNTLAGPDDFAIPATLSEGTHQLRVDWDDHGTVTASRAITVTRQTPAPDADRDGVADGVDNCPQQPNADQADLDHDHLGNVCDDDMDGDGYTNDRERAKGTDPADASSHPGKKGGGKNAVTVR
jgi:hypothetical protein